VGGGWAGSMFYGPVGPSLAGAPRAGYATAATDTGHNGTAGDGSFAFGHPEKVIDFAYRAVHETTVRAKAIITAYYEPPPTVSYWNGCSTGGKQRLKEAQRFPEDYDGTFGRFRTDFRLTRRASCSIERTFLERNPQQRPCPRQC
jgi:feruloyl esterase